jgi:hypothetical protein
MENTDGYSMIYYRECGFLSTENKGNVENRIELEAREYCFMMLEGFWSVPKIG